MISKALLRASLQTASDPSPLLLDEPLSGMGPQERVETVKLPKAISRGRTMIIIDYPGFRASMSRRT
jgi:branched-chain amino acid transport system permease protein